MTLEALRDVRLFKELSLQARASLAQSAAQRLGERWSAGALDKDLWALELEERQLGLPFVLIPGGSFQMGLTEADRSQVRSLLTPEQYEDAFSASFSEMYPAHTVHVLPFLVSRQMLEEKDLERLFGPRFKGPHGCMLGRQEARSVVQELGMRLPSEAELEWIAREGGQYAFTLDAGRKLDEIRYDSQRLQSRFGAMELFEFQWAEDDYHPTYQQAPSSSEPWMQGDPTGVLRGGSGPEYVDEPQQVVGLLAAMRGFGRSGHGGVRLAMSLKSLV